ncbi:hypothetical protein AVEN_262906-1 [Araneus ventricosus]|uniref:Uncharacterized protein n=1 Tax=Araneus ventricosus TaxID=182803 RepID=A0A4Y2DI83_ARAVE|nr:hypothetical protein AVEN_262906-1 [Araneus ventricosus]
MLVFRAGSSNSRDLSYDVHPMFSKVTVAPPAIPESLTSFSDRTVNSEAMLLSFLAEKSLPLSLAPDILESTNTTKLKIKKSIRPDDNTSHCCQLQATAWCS